MYNSIEIPDSDDDMPEPATDPLAKLITNDSESNGSSPEKQLKMSDLKITKSSESPSSIDSPPRVSNTGNSCGGSGSNSSATQSHRHRSRKTQHTVRPTPDIEMQFESIPLDEDKTTLKIPITQDTTAPKPIVQSMLATPEMQELIQKIAKERVRCNFLLATYNLPDMNFSINNSTEVLKNQFRERLKQRKERAARAIKPKLPALQ